jgi:GAF domain-containing protein
VYSVRRSSRPVALVRPRFISDVSRDPRSTGFLDAYRKLGVEAYVAAPLVRNGELVSALVVAMAESHEWNEREIALIILSLNALG